MRIVSILKIQIVDELKKSVNKNKKITVHRQIATVEFLFFTSYRLSISEMNNSAHYILRYWCYVQRTMKFPVRLVIASMYVG